MGPESSETSANGPIEALGPTATIHKFLYRNDVRMWMRRVEVFATGGDTRAKSV